MFPHEAEALIGKVLLIVFATFALCYAKANAEMIKTPIQNIDVSTSVSL